MRLLVSGASGFIGASLVRHLKKLGHSLVFLVRKPLSSENETILWNPEEGKAPKDAFEDFDAVIHLAGEPVGAFRWTPAKKKRILYSRTVGTWFLSQLLSQLLRPPKIFIAASAVGYYGDRGEELLTEESAAGRGFLPSVCCEWEKASRSIEERGARVVRARLGTVLGRNGGVLKKLIPAYKLGLGGRLGSGMQWISWIALTDLVHLLEHFLHISSLEGAVNCVSPYPIRQKEFSQTLAKELHRPAFLHLPAPFLRLLIGEAADELLLASMRALPTKLLASGFTFRYPFLADALKT